jgi:hypothetical protein
MQRKGVEVLRKRITVTVDLALAYGSASVYTCDLLTITSQMPTIAPEILPGINDTVHPDILLEVHAGSHAVCCLLALS